MNLAYVKNYLQEHKEGITQADIELLISEISSYLGTAGTMKDISKVMRTINEYNITFLTLVEDYEAIPKKNSAFLTARLEKAREILCTLSTLHTYLTLSLSSIKESTFNMKNIRSYVSELAEKKELFKSEKMTWITILKSLTQEANYMVEIRRLDIEDQMGFIKSKKV